MANYSKKQKWYKKHNYKGKKFDTRFKSPYKQNRATNLTSNLSLISTISLSLNQLHKSTLVICQHLPAVYYNTAVDY
jgi:hypothetical protein